MSAVLLIPLGVGEAFTAQHYTSCYALGHRRRLAHDRLPPSGAKNALGRIEEAGLPEPLDLDRIRAVAVSHLHADHCSGLEDFGYFSFFALVGELNSLMHPEASVRSGTGFWPLGWSSCRRTLTKRRIVKSSKITLSLST